MYVRNICIFLPKLHKTPLKVRPIVACCGGPTEATSALLDKFLQPIMRNIKSYVANSTDFICKLDALTPPPNCTLVTLDVASLYTNVSHEDALDAVRITLEKVSLPLLHPIDVVLQLLT